MANKNRNSYFAYSDESGTFDHRYQSIAVVSGTSTVLDQLKSLLNNAISDHGIIELKFNDIRGYQSSQAKVARQFIQFTIKKFILKGSIRIDILTWDMNDSRHDIPNRDDIANPKYMYYKVLLHIARQWHQVKWNFHPDINSKIPWNEIRNYLNISSLIPANQQERLLDFPADKGLFEFVMIQPLDSIQESLIQLADLFAGMARFSSEEHKRCVDWLTAHGSRYQLKLNGLCSPEDRNSRRSRSIRTKECLYQLVGNLDKLCKKHKLGVSLITNNRLHTFNRNNPINFWNYEPQGAYDKAPTKL